MTISNFESVRLGRFEIPIWEAWSEIPVWVHSSRLWQLARCWAHIWNLHKIFDHIECRSFPYIVDELRCGRIKSTWIWCWKTSLYYSICSKILRRFQMCSQNHASCPKSWAASLNWNFVSSLSIWHSYSTQPNRTNIRTRHKNCSWLLSYIENET